SPPSNASTFRSVNIYIYVLSTAGISTLISFSATSFYSSLESSQFSHACNATLSATGLLSFFASSDGGTAQIVLGFAPALNIGGYLFIDDHNAPGVTIGSLEDDGTGTATVSLGANNLTVGSNHLSTT